MSDLDRFEIFTYVAQVGSLTQAASCLGVTKASVSKQIKRLEQDFKVDLFTRYKQRLQLTTTGELLFEQCLYLKKELKAARDLCQQFHQEPSGDLCVVVFGYFAQKIIFPKLKGFLKQYPKINLKIDTTERVPDFSQEAVDLAIGFSLPVPNPGEVIQKKMATTHYVLCATPGYFNEFGKPQQLRDLHQHQYIEHASRANQSSIKLKANYQIKLQPYLLVNTVASMIECAKQGLGLIQLPLYMVDNLLSEGIFEAVLEEYQAVNASVYYHYPKRRYMQATVRKFIDYFLSPNKSSK